MATEVNCSCGEKATESGWRFNGEGNPDGTAIRLLLCSFCDRFACPKCHAPVMNEKSLFCKEGHFIGKLHEVRLSIPEAMPPQWGAA